MRKLFLIAVLVLFLPCFALAEIWEFAICKQDEVESLRMKQGDIIAYKPHPWTWGRAEVGMYLIVIIDGLTRGDAERLKQDYYKDGLDYTQADRDLENPTPVIGARKYKISVIALKNKVLPTLDITKASNKSVVYQPFKDQAIKVDAASVAVIVDKHEGKLINKPSAPTSEVVR